MIASAPATRPESGRRVLLLPFNAAHSSRPALKGEIMDAEKSALAKFLGDARVVAGTAHNLAFDIREERDEAKHNYAGIVSGMDWANHTARFKKLREAILALAPAIETPPRGGEALARHLEECARVVRNIERATDPIRGSNFPDYHEYVVELQTAAEHCCGAIKTIEGTHKPNDEWAFLDRQKSDSGERQAIDTTPAMPCPPDHLIEAAALRIPEVLGNVEPDKDDRIEMAASELAEQIQAAGHTLAAAQWAIHTAIQDGRLAADRRPNHPMIWWLGDDDDKIGPFGSDKFYDLPESGPAPFHAFLAVAMPELWAWWRAITAAKDERHASAVTPGSAASASSAGMATKALPAAKGKRSTAKGEGRIKLVSALLTHHKYETDSCLNTEPIGNNELARLAGVDQATASAFFKKEFGGHSKYKASCADQSRLLPALRLLNGDFSPHHLYGKTPPSERERDDE